MHLSIASCLTAAIAILPVSTALNIIVNNDDGFGSANIREFYRLLKVAGHDVRMVAPVDNESGQGGRSVFTSSPTLTIPSEYNLVPAGAPSFGQDPVDSNIFYYNGTPAAVTFVAFDFVVPKYTNWTKVDLLVAGPNFGNNLGPFLYTLSGTIGATYTAVERGIPAIAFSDGGSGTQRSYKEINATTKSGSPDPATINAQLSVSLVEQLIKNGNKSQLLPLGYGLNVNYPAITSLVNDSCVKPKFIQSRLTGGADVDKAVFNATTGLFRYGDIVSPGANTCINGDCSLPGETDVVSSGCFSAVSVFTVDYDAPNCKGDPNVQKLLTPLVQYQNATMKRDVSPRRFVRRSYLDEEI